MSLQHIKSLSIFVAVLSMLAGSANAANHKSEYGNSHNNYKAGASSYGPSHGNYNGRETFTPGLSYGPTHNDYSNHSHNDYGSQKDPAIPS